LDQGEVVGRGTHEQLMVANQTYREIVLSQLTEEEAA
jgi:ATP-binding cassette subfamily B protein